MQCIGKPFIIDTTVVWKKYKMKSGLSRTDTSFLIQKRFSQPEMYTFVPQFTLSPEIRSHMARHCGQSKPLPFISYKTERNKRRSKIRHSSCRVRLKMLRKTR